MRARRGRAWYHGYRKNEVRLHLVLCVLVASSVALLFSCRSFTWVCWLGAVFAGASLILLVLLIVGSDIWFPRLPDDVWAEANSDTVFEVHARSMDQQFELLSRADAGEVDRYRAMSGLVEEAISIYRERYTVQLLRRGVRRLLILGCIVFAFASVARLLVLVDSSSYGHHLALHSTVIDYVYYAFIAVSTIGYGDIAPVGMGARVVSIAFGGITIVYLLMIINYVWMHEARREGLLIQYLDERYLGLAR